MVTRKGIKRINNDLQSTPQKTRDRAARFPLITGGDLRCSGRFGRTCFIGDTRRITVNQDEHHV